VSKPAPRRPRDDSKNTRDRATSASTPSVASNSVGRGRSDASTNYRGLVSAHLARYKQMPGDLRNRGVGHLGSATVSFSLDGNGRVTSVRLARGSGVPSIDQETQAMVRRASPFPAPPSGQPANFNVLVNFDLR
jgi:protein TonB